MANMASACALVLSNRDHKNLFTSMRSWNGKGAVSTCALVTVSAVCIVIMVVSGVWLAREHFLSSGYEASTCWVTNVTYAGDQPCHFCTGHKEKLHQSYQMQAEQSQFSAVSPFPTYSSCFTSYFPCLQVIVTYHISSTRHNALLYQDSLQASGLHNKCSYYVCKEKRAENVAEVSKFAKRWERLEQLYREKQLLKNKVKQESPVELMKKQQHVALTKLISNDTLAEPEAIIDNKMATLWTPNTSLITTLDLKKPLIKDIGANISEEDTTSNTSLKETTKTNRKNVGKSSFPDSSNDHTFVCFYNKENYNDVILTKVYSTWDVVNGMLWPGLVFLLCCFLFLRMETKRRHLTFCGVREDHKDDNSSKKTTRHYISHRESVCSHVYPVSTTLTLLDQGKALSFPYGNVVCDVAPKNHSNIKKISYEENLRQQALLQQQLHNLQQSYQQHQAKVYQHAYHRKPKMMKKQHSEDCNFNNRLLDKPKQSNERKHSDNNLTLNTNSTLLQQSFIEDYSDQNLKNLQLRPLHDHAKSHSMSALRAHDTANEKVIKVFENRLSKREKRPLCDSDGNDLKIQIESQSNNPTIITTDSSPQPDYRHHKSNSSFPQTT